MQISTTSFFDRSLDRMTLLNGQADKLQTQISTGKKFTGAADDSVAYQQLAGIKQATADDSAYASNVKLAQGLVAQTDSTLGNVSQQIQRAQELATQANSGTLSQSDRTSIAAELDSILGDLYSMANSTDMRGQPLFGDSSGNLPFTQNADGSITATNAGDPAGIPIGANATIQATTGGARVFGGDGSSTPDIFATIGNLSAALKAGGDVSTAAGQALDGLNASFDQVNTVRASVGARGARLDLESSRLADAATANETSRSAIEDTDVTAAITQLQKTLTILQATQASFTKLSNMSLFNYLN